MARFTRKTEGLELGRTEERVCLLFLEHLGGLIFQTGRKSRRDRLARLAIATEKAFLAVVKWLESLVCEACESKFMEGQIKLGTD